MGDLVYKDWTRNLQPGTIDQWGASTRENRQDSFWRLCHGFENIKKYDWSEPKIRQIVGAEKMWLIRDIL